jgi:hypothetical protein
MNKKSAEAQAGSLRCCAKKSAGGTVVESERRALLYDFVSNVVRTFSVRWGAEN